MGLFLAITSWMCVWIGVLYIENVWHERNAMKHYTICTFDVTGLFFTLWAAFLIATHVFAILVFRKFQKKTNVQSRFQSTIFQTNIPGFKPSKFEPEPEGDLVTAKKMVVDDNDSPSEEVMNNNGEKGGNYKEDPPTHAENEGDQKQDPSEDAEIESNQSNESYDNIVMPQLKSWKTANDFFVSAAEAPSFWYLLRVKMYDTYGLCCCCGHCPCCCKDIKHDNILNSASRIDPINRVKKNNLCWRFSDGMKLFLWYCASIFFLFLTIVNCGATAQQTVVRNSLDKAFEFLYPINYHTGPMW